MSKYPQAFLQKMRKSRAIHKCCECGRQINISDKYEYSSGIWDGQPNSFKTCKDCSEIRDELIGETGEPVAFCDLAESIRDLFYKSYGPIEYAESSGIELHKIMALFQNYYEGDSEK